MQGYALVPVATTPHALDAIAGLLREVFPNAPHLDARYLRWLYADNPAGAVIGLDAWQDERLVAHYAVIPFAARLDGAPARAALSLNTAVHPAHRGRHLFTQLAGGTCELARAAGVQHVVGVANAQSTPGFVGPLGFTDLGPLDAWLLWSRPALREASPASWQRVWDHESLAWRLRDSPRPYTLEAWGDTRAVLAPTGRAGISAVLQLERESSLAGMGLAPAAGPWLRLWLGRSRRVSCPSLGGMTLPPMLRPSPLTLIFRALDAGQSPPDPGAVEFAALDFDAY